LQAGLPYCDFHFSTSLGKKEAMILALQKELELRKNEFEHTPVATIYFWWRYPIGFKYRRN